MKIFNPVLLFLFFILILTHCTQPKEDPYTAEIIKYRLETTEFMQNSPESPFHKKGDIAYDGLKYYDINQSFNIKAVINTFPSPEEVEIEMSDGSKVEYFKYATAGFSLDGKTNELILYKSEAYWDQDWLFLPFYDETSALETYGGGRFLEVTYTSGDYVMIDFNKAYNPYCAYNGDYRCPVPPAENRLEVSIKAGEKNYKDHH